MDRYTVMPISTMKPHKWVAIDLETNDLWVWDTLTDRWVRARRGTIVEVGKLVIEALE